MVGIYGLMLAVWFCTIVNRSLLGASGPEILTGSGVSPAGLALPGVAQVIFYAAMQFPVAGLLRRIGPHRCLTIGLGLLLVAQLGMVWQNGLGQIVLTRALYGVGDSFMFVSIVTIVAAVRKGAAFSPAIQLMGVVGQLAQFVVYVGLGPALSLVGWTGPQIALGAINLAAFLAVATRGRRLRWKTDPPKGERVGQLRRLWAPLSVAALSHITFMMPTLSIGAVYLYAFVRNAQSMPLWGATVVMTVFIVSSFLVNAGIWRHLRRHGTGVFALAQGLAWTLALGISTAGVITLAHPLAGSVLLAAVLGGCGAATLLSFSLVPEPWTGTAASVALVNIAGYLAGGVGLGLCALFLALDPRLDGRSLGYHVAFFAVSALMITSSTFQRGARWALDRRTDDDGRHGGGHG